jgi:hypothetical protein
MMLRVAFDCGSPESVSRVPTVFASRYGDVTATIELLDSLARQKPLTANRFSHSVHNTQAALFSIIAANRRASTAMAGGRDTFPCAFLEALSVLSRGSEESVLLVIGDEPLPAMFRRFTDDPMAAYAAAFLLTGANNEPSAISLDLAVGKPDVDSSWPQAIEFLRWFLSGKPALTLGSSQHYWRWRRAQRSACLA